MYDFVRVYAEQALAYVIDTSKKIIVFYEWYSHARDIKRYESGSYFYTIRNFGLSDDDEDCVEDFDIYFNEYDWETEKKQRGDRR